jgi:Tfp pilus assembly protein PilN
MIIQADERPRVNKDVDKSGKGWNWLTNGLLSEGSALGVYWDGAGLTLAQVQRTFTGFAVPNLTQLFPSGGGLDELAQPLADITAAWRLDGAPAGVAVSQELGFVQPATLPRAAAENLAQVVSYELDRFLPLPADRLYVDFQVLATTETDIRLMLLALRREPVEILLRLLTQAGLRLTFLTLAPAAAANAFAALGNKTPPDWLLLHLGQQGFELNHIIGDALHSCQTGRPGPTGELAREVGSALADLRQDGAGPEVLYLYGAGVSPEARETLSRKLQVSLVTPELLKVEGLALGAIPGEALPALGAGLVNFGAGIVKANLLPVPERAPLTLGSFVYSRWLLVSFLALASLWLFSLFIVPRVQLHQVNRQIAQLAPEVQEIERQIQERLSAEKQTASFQRLEQSPHKLEILKRLTEMIPQHTWLTQLRISQQTLEISGVSKAAADLIPILEKSGWLTKTEFVSPILTDANKLEHFKIKAEIKSLAPGA